MAWAPLCVLPDQGDMMEDVHDSQAQWIHPAIGKGALTDRNNMKKMGREWASSARFEEHLKTCLRDESLFHLVCGHGYKDHFATCL